MKWTNFEESEKEYPEKIVERTIEGFSKATKGLVEMKISELSDMARITTKVPGDFLFTVRLISPFVKEYSLKLLTFGYDVEINPINFIVEAGIHKELYKEPLGYGAYMTCEDGQMFENVLKKIFSSQKFKETVTGLMKIARKNHARTQKK